MDKLPKKLIQNPLKTQYTTRIKNPVNNYKQDWINSILKINSVMKIARLVVTIVLLSWLISISICILKQKRVNTDASPQELPDHNRYFNLHRVWFGDEAPIFVLFRIWYYVFIFMVISPFLYEIFVVIGPKLMQ